jgi:FkbM family methyltransferase
MHVREGRRLRLIQIGANDGSEMDPVRALIDSGYVSAVLVEPIPELCDGLRAMHDGNADVRVVEAAVSATDGELSLFVPKAADGQVVNSLFASTDRSLLERNLRNHGGGVSSRVEQVDVRAVSVPTLLRLAEWDTADVFVIDAEGHDSIIVRALLDAGVRPGMVQFECCNMSCMDFTQISDVFDEHGYALARTGLDALAVAQTRP